MWSFVLIVVAVVIVCTTHWVYRWRNPIINGKLPPGSMGFPLVGETLYLFTSQSTFDLHPFIKKRIIRYGPVFKTNLLRQPVVISADPEFSHFVFQQEGNSVEQYTWFLDYFNNSVEKQMLNLHKYIRNMVLDFFGTDKQKEKLLSEIEEMARRNIAIWSEQESIELKEVTTHMAFGLASKKLLSYDPSKYPENFQDMLTHLLHGLMAFPVNIPGTAYNRCLKDLRTIMKVLKDKVKERFDSPASQHEDFLDVLVEEMKKDEHVFTVEMAANIILAIYIASFETISLALTLAIKFISEDQSVLEELTGEHEKIVKSRENVDSAITWNEYKSMTFTSHVINELLRLGNVAPLIIRKVTKDIQVDGYTIPSGWAIMVCPPAIHLNPDKYEDPLAFNPWRWKGQGSNTVSKNFMPFGGGMRLCAGSEFTKLQLSIVLHFLVTKYRWTKIKGGEIVQTVGVDFPNGLHIKVTENY